MGLVEPNGTYAPMWSALQTLIGAPVNQAPTVSAGSAQTVLLPASARLSGTASDDGLPYPPGQLSYQWSVVSGPGTVNFTNATSLTASAAFSAAGTYVLKLSASDGQLTSNSQVTIIVQSGTPNLVLTKSGSVTTAKSGDTITFTIQYQNTGTSDAVNVVLKDPVPAGTTLTGTISNGGTNSDGTIQWNLGTVPAATGGTLTFQVQVN